MASRSLSSGMQSSGDNDAISQLMANRGSAHHAYVQQLYERPPREAAEALLDAVHHLALLHGRLPGVIEEAAHQSAILVETRAWFDQAIDAFIEERRLLTKIMAMGPPNASLIGQAANHLALEALKLGISALAQSGRVGCAFGAAAALVIDWAAIRRVLTLASVQFDLSLPSCSLPPAQETIELMDRIAPAFDRAILFGAGELLTRHQKLWDLLADRDRRRLSI